MAFPTEDNKNNKIAGLKNQTVELSKMPENRLNLLIYPKSSILCFL